VYDGDMLRLFPIFIAMALIIGASIYFLFFRSQTHIAGIVLPNSDGSDSLEIRISALEESVNKLAAQISVSPKPASSASPGGGSINESKLADLDNKMGSLITRMNQLEAQKTTSSTSLTSTAPTTSTSKYPQYIYPLGYGGSSSAADWTEITTLTITIDPSLYPGYKDMKLEAYIRVKDGNGKAYARLYSSTSPVVLSEVSTTSFQNTWTSSGGFSLSGKKTYTFQVKSLTGYEAYLENARVVVNY
jgi:hypothetical protein